MSKSSAVFRVDNAILSFPHLWEPKPYMQNGVPQGEPFYSCVLLLDQVSVDLINKVAMDLAMVHYATKKEYTHQSFGWPVYPCAMKASYANDPRVAALSFVNTKASVKFPPSVVEPDGKGGFLPVKDRGSIYSGCVVSAAINVFTRPQPARMGEVGQGVGVGLKAIIKTRDGEPLAESIDLDSMFGGVVVQQSTASFFPGGAPLGTANTQESAQMPPPPSFLL